MPNPLKEPLLALQRRLTAAIGTDISSPKARRAAWWHFQLMDHAFLRLWWKNLDQVAPGVWRSNQPSVKDLERLAAQGLKTVLNLRGATEQSYWLFEAEACRRLGLTLIDLKLAAKQPPRRDQLLDLIATFDRAETPLLMHCKSGADRTGLAAAVWRLVKMGDDAATAQRQLSWRFLHLKRERAGVQDQVIRAYQAEAEPRGISFRDWAAHEYDPERVKAGFARYLEGKG
jgi:protein tyrosine/serine phosphatase